MGNEIGALDKSGRGCAGGFFGGGSQARRVTARGEEAPAEAALFQQRLLEKSVSRPKDRHQWIARRLVMGMVGAR